MKFIAASLLLLGLSTTSIAQDDMLSMLTAEATEETGSKPVFATFKTAKLINAQTIETVKKKILDFRITHRFGSIGANAAHGLYGIDYADDVRFSFDYGITDKLQVGVGRSKYNELLDGSVKWKILQQTQDNKMPVSVSWHSMMGITPKVSPEIEGAPIYTGFSDRLSYTHQLLIARKFGDYFSAILLPTVFHQNTVLNYTNVNGDQNENMIFALGVGGRIKISPRSAIMFDYYHDFSKFRSAAPDANSMKYGAAAMYYQAFGIGLEIETGGHVFHITFTNASGIVENNFLAGNTAPVFTDDWTPMIKLGFNISRQFNL